jgi:hypothetical protein
VRKIRRAGRLPWHRLKGHVILLVGVGLFYLTISVIIAISFLAVLYSYLRRL